MNWQEKQLAEDLRSYSQGTEVFINKNLLGHILADLRDNEDQCSRSGQSGDSIIQRIKIVERLTD